MNRFRTLITPCPLIFISNLSNIDEVALVANLGKTYLAKGTERPNNALLPKLPITLPNARQLSFTKFYICQHVVSEGISVFVFCIVKSNS